MQFRVPHLYCLAEPLATPQGPLRTETVLQPRMPGSEEDEFLQPDHPPTPERGGKASGAGAPKGGSREAEVMGWRCLRFGFSIFMFLR